VPTPLSIVAEPAQATPEACAYAEQIPTAAIGQLAPDELQALQAHLGRCEPCARARNDLVERVAAWGNRLLYKPQLAWLNDGAWLAPYQKYLAPDRAQGSITRVIDRRFTLIQMCRAVRSLRGSTAECGVLYGVGSAIVCKTLETTYCAGEHHFGFDSFAGLSEPTAPDQTRYAWQKKGELAVTADVAKRLLGEFAFCRLIKDWIPDSLAVAVEHRFRLVHLDLDLYQPTLDALTFFYPRMVPRGLIVVDDYGHLSCLGVRAAVDQFFNDKPETVLETVDGVGFVSKLEF
jgi:hypothetical protein